MKGNPAFGLACDGAEDDEAGLLASCMQRWTSKRRSKVDRQTQYINLDV
jgi:hypothetical protein